MVWVDYQVLHIPMKTTLRVNVDEDGNEIDNLVKGVGSQPIRLKVVDYIINDNVGVFLNARFS